MVEESFTEITRTDLRPLRKERWEPVESPVKSSEKKSKKKKLKEWKPISKRILKKEPRATYVIKAPEERSSSFQKEWSRSNLLGWR